MGENIQEIGNVLIKNNHISLRILGLQMVKQNNILKRKQPEQQYRDKLYKLFLKSIDKETAQRLIEIDFKLSKAISEFENKTGWTVTENGVFLDNNYPPNLEKKDDSNIFKVPRDNLNGFYLPPLKEDASYIEKRMRSGEEQFFMQHIEELNAINELMCSKEEIMSGNYDILDDNIDNSLVNMITNYLGYSKSKENAQVLKLKKELY